MRQLNLRWPTTCTACGCELPKGTWAWWDSDAKTATCENCYQPAASESQPEAGREPTAPLEPGEAGGSARREYDRRSQRERERKEARVAQDAEWRAQIKAKRPVIGRVAAAITPKPVVTPESQSTAAWNTGAVGEEQLGGALETLDGVRVLHDRRMPKSKANIDHILISSAGVFVVDAKRYRGRVQHRDAGSFFRPNVKLYVGSRDCTKLLDGVIRQAQVVRELLDDDARVSPALCFIDSEWSLFGRPFAVDGVWIGWPKALGKWVTQDGSLGVEAVDAYAHRLAATLKPA